MSTTNDLQLAKFLKMVLDIIFGFLVFACIALVLWMMLSPLIIRFPEIQATASVPVMFGTGEESQINVSFTTSPDVNISNAFVDQAEGALHLENRSIKLIAIANAAKLVLVIGLAYVFFLLRGVVQTILNGDPFKVENVRRIRLLGYSVAVIGILTPVVDYFAASEILNRLPSTVPPLRVGSTFNFGLILDALFILLLAQIWSYGLELERDRALTI